MSETTPNAPTGAQKTLDGGTGEMFDAIAERYDMLNRILSLGQDQYWRKRAMRSLAMRPGDHILDLATGTGDLAIMIARRNHDVRVEGVDPSAGMLEVGRDKVHHAGLGKRVSMTLGDGLAIPFEEDSFDGAIVAFGIRNFPDRLQGLREMARVTRPGRHVVVLELGEPEKGLTSTFAKAYIHHVVPAIGSALSGKEEYRYLQKSIAAFPTSAEFVALMQEAGLEDARCTPLSFGAVNLYVGRVPLAD